nr:MADS-box transcription factor, plant [Ipomoea batatas]
MEVANFVMSFYKAAKPLSPQSFSGQDAKIIVPRRPCSSSSRKKVLQSAFSGSSDGYIHGPDGGAGDKNVDLKATSYIFQVKERLRLEELKIMNENLKLGL